MPHIPDLLEIIKILKPARIDENFRGEDSPALGADDNAASAHSDYFRYYIGRLCGVPIVELSSRLCYNGWGSVDVAPKGYG
jgi:hypothetical protein